MNEKLIQCVIVKALTVNDEGKILMVRRDEQRYKDAHGRWEFPGGGIDFGECLEETCIREVKEEAGYDVGVESMIPISQSFVYENSDNSVQIILLAFLCRVVGGEISLEDENVSDVKWFTPLEVRNLETLDGTFEILDEFERMNINY